MALVSIIIPCYNQGHFLQEAVNSLLEQTFKDFEIIIVNDGSTDPLTNKIINVFKKNDLKVIETINQGLPEARNTGIKYSNGKYILTLDADNKLAPDYLEISLKAFNQFECDIIYTDAYLFGGKTGIWVQPQIEFPLMLKRNLIDACAIYTKIVWEACGGYNRNMLYGWEDWDLWLTAYENKFQFHHINKPLFYYRVGINSMRNQIDIQKHRRIYLEQQLIMNHPLLYFSYFAEPLTLLRELDDLRHTKKEFELYKKKINNILAYKVVIRLLRTSKWVKRVILNCTSRLSCTTNLNDNA